MISKEKKQQIIKELLEQIKDAKAIYFVNFLGLKVSKMNELRQELKKGNAKVRVVKKNLAKIVFSKEGYMNEIIDDKASSLVLNFAFEDPINTAKALWNFSRKSNKISKNSVKRYTFRSISWFNSFSNATLIICFKWKYSEISCSIG